MERNEIFCLIFSAVSMLFDIKSEKVSNYWNLFGWLMFALLCGLKWERLIGMMTPIVLLFPLFVCKMIGTGDIKVFMVLGYAMGMEKILLCITYSFLISACVSLPLILYRCNWRQRFTYFFTYLKTVFETGTFPPYLASGKSPENIHFTIFIFCSVLLCNVQGGFV